MMISLSILEYEPDLSAHVDSLAESEAFSQIVRLIQTGRIRLVHIDVMRPPMIPGRTRFPNELIMRLHETLHERIPLAIHLMVKDPFPIVEKISEFILKEERHKTTIFIQVESFSSEEETIKSLNLLKEYGYKAGICLDLPTPGKILTPKIIETADAVLLMSVPMGEGGQKYSDKATKKIAHFSQKYPHKTIEVDGGINLQTIVLAQKAGAKIAVVGSFITQNEDPARAIQNLELSLKQAQK